MQEWCSWTVQQLSHRRPIIETTRPIIEIRPDFAFVTQLILVSHCPEKNKIGMADVAARGGVVQQLFWDTQDVIWCNSRLELWMKV